MKKVICLLFLVCIAFPSFGDEYVFARKTNLRYSIKNQRTDKFVNNEEYTDGRDLGVYNGRHYFAFLVDNSWGVWSVANNMVRNDVPAKFDEIYFDFYRGYFIFKLRGDNGLCHVDNVITIPNMFKSVNLYDDYVQLNTWSGESNKMNWEDVDEFKDLCIQERETKTKQMAEKAEEEKHRAEIEMSYSSFRKSLEQTIKQNEQVLRAFFAKDEFEKSITYFKRACGLALVNKYDEVLADAKQHFIATHDSLLRHDPRCKLRISRYDADKETFEISSRYIEPLHMKVSMSQAQDFKSAFNSLVIGDLILDIKNDKIICNSLTLINRFTGVLYSYDAPKDESKPQYFILDLSRVNFPYCNIQTGRISGCQHSVAIVDPQESTICDILNTKGSVTIKGDVKYGLNQSNPNLHYFLWEDGIQRSNEITVKKKKKYESFSFEILKGRGKRFILVVADDNGNVSPSIIIDLDGVMKL